MSDLKNAFPTAIFEKRLEIRREDLDEELITQADLFYKVAKELAQATSLRDQAYQNIKMVDAALSQSIRQDAKEKMTESAINTAVLSHDDHEAAVREHLALNTYVDRMSALKEAYQQRSFMLSKLVDLFSTGFFGDVSSPKQRRREEEYKGGREDMASARAGTVDKGRRRLGAS